MWNIVLMDWFWVLRCRADVVAEVKTNNNCVNFA